MKPKVGQKATYVDESFTEYTATIVEVFDLGNDNFTVGLEYKHEDRQTRKVTQVPFVDGMHDARSKDMVKCYSKKTSTKTPKNTTSGTKVDLHTNNSNASSTTASVTVPPTELDKVTAPSTTEQ